MTSSPAYSFIKERIELEFHKLEKDKVTPWAFFLSGKELRLTNFLGNEISYSGILFEGSPRTVFWNGFIQPFLKDISSRSFENTRNFCLTNRLELHQPMEETADLLKAGISRIFERMSDIDQRLCGKGNPSSVPKYDAITERAGSVAFVEERLAAELALAQHAAGGKLMLKEMKTRDLREKVETLQNMLIARATGSNASDIDYRELRDELIASPDLRELLPSFVRTSRELAQFWAYIKKEDGYAQRRKVIWAAFNPLLQALEDTMIDASAGVDSNTAVSTPIQDLENLPVKKTTKAFISYSMKDKHAAAAVKHTLSTAGIECFLAHDDLQVSEEWKERILYELLHCDIFVPLLSRNFKESDWAPQEIGIITSRPKVPIVPLSLDDTIPFGFISHIQGRPVPPNGLEIGTILNPISKKHPRLVIPAMINRVRNSGSFRGAEAAMQPLVQHFNNLADEELKNLVDACVDNGQVWNAALCRTEYLPELMNINEARINPDKLRALQYQVEHARWYREDESPKDNAINGVSAYPVRADLELKLRNHPDITSLNKYPDRQRAAEAAIAYFCYGTEPNVKAWKRSTTWHIVESVFKGL